MSTLTTKEGIVWSTVKHNGNCAFLCGPHAICFNDRTGYFHLTELGETRFIAKYASDCLEASSEYIWDFHADQIVPMWEQ